MPGSNGVQKRLGDEREGVFGYRAKRRPFTDSKKAFGAETVKRRDKGCQLQRGLARCVVSRRVARTLSGYECQNGDAGRLVGKPPIRPATSHSNVIRISKRAGPWTYVFVEKKNTFHCILSVSLFFLQTSYILEYAAYSLSKNSRPVREPVSPRKSTF